MSNNSMRRHWWKGQRGEWYVVVQMLLIALVVLGPSNWSGLPTSPAFLMPGARIVGGVLIAGGALLTLMATLNLGSNLTPLPHPRDESQLVVTGTYRLVRHPIYSGILFAAFGWALWTQGWLTLIYALLLLLFFDIKSRREEVWLAARYPDYPAYRQRVRKLIPFLY